MRSKLLCSTIYMLFDHPKTGISLKDRSLYGELREYVPIQVSPKFNLLLPHGCFE